MSIKGINNDPYGKIMDQNNAANNNAVNKTQKARLDNHDSTVSNIAKKGDEVNLSSDSKIRAEAYRVAMKTEDIREEKVAEIKARVDAGTYTIDSKKLAENILSSEEKLFK